MATQSPSVAAGTRLPSSTCRRRPERWSRWRISPVGPRSWSPSSATICPYVRHVESALARVAADYEGSGLATFAISANDVASPSRRVSTRHW